MISDWKETSTQCGNRFPNRYGSILPTNIYKFKSYKGNVLSSNARCSRSRNMRSSWDTNLAIRIPLVSHLPPFASKHIYTSIKRWRGGELYEQ